jgi:group I intron endonuclease
MNIKDLKAAGEFAQNFGCSGIYKILNNTTNKCYIGSAIHIGNRFKSHKKKLKAGSHPNRHLQSAYNLVGLKAFSFSVLETCSAEVLLEREKYWIEWTLCYIPEYGYNKRKIPNSNLGIKFSDETKAKMSKSRIGRIPRQGFTTPDETKIKISKAMTGKSKPHFRNLEKYPHGQSCRCSIECIEARRKANRDNYYKNKSIGL